MRVKNLVMLILLILLVAVFASGQAQIIAEAKIPFAFSVAGKVLAAGGYRFTEHSNTRVIIVRSSDGGTSVMAGIITRLAAGIHTSPQDSHIVFDKVGDSYTLSEIWAPDRDGFMLHITKEKHEHRIMDTPK
jgi:hypothetical protein